MAKVTWSVPLVQFGRCEIEFAEQDVLENPELFGRRYADFVHSVTEAFKARGAEIRDGKVNVPAPPSEGPETPAESLEEASQLIKSELGATEVEDDAPPWERKSTEKSEPWKNQGPVRKPAKINW